MTTPICKEDPILSVVRWEDSRGVHDCWVRNDSYDGICEVVSVGYIIDEDETSIHIVPHIIPEEEGEMQLCGDMYIPIRSIVERNDLMKWIHPSKDESLKIKPEGD